MEVALVRQIDLACAPSGRRDAQFCDVMLKGEGTPESETFGGFVLS